jgi:hypothetical protein
MHAYMQAASVMAVEAEKAAEKEADAYMYTYMHA